MIQCPNTKLNKKQRIKFIYNDSWIKYIEYLAKKGYFFTEISSIVGSEWGNSSLSNIGMTKYAKYEFGGTMYKYSLSSINKRI